MMNGRAIMVRAAADMPVIGGPKTMMRFLPEEIRERHKDHAYVPSLAYRIALVAQGVLDASFVKPNSRDWDLAAADLILAEAGGRIVNAKGEEPLYATLAARHGPLAAGSGALLEAMAGVVASYAPQAG
jgi:myo-inositol-1(or 4)-monophosphatase